MAWIRIYHSAPFSNAKNLFGIPCTSRFQLDTAWCPRFLVFPDSMPAAIPGGASVGNCGHSGNCLGMGKPSQITHGAHGLARMGPTPIPVARTILIPFQSHCGLGMGSMGLPTQIPGGPHPGSLSGLIPTLRPPASVGPIDLRIPASYEVKIAKICNFWTFWPVIQLIKMVYINLLIWIISWIIGQNVQRLLIFAVFAL